jgi:RimJ/RimL family protein N-acetyltransferase
MSWTPPPLATARLTLVSAGNGAQPSFCADGRPAADQGLPGLPSNWRIHLDGHPIGSVGFIRWEPEAGLGEIGFVLTASFRNRGYMTEACRAVLAFGFGDMGLRQIEAKSLPTNIASVRVLEKLGMERGPRIQTRLSAKGERVEMDVYDITRAITRHAPASA